MHPNLTDQRMRHILLGVTSDNERWRPGQLGLKLGDPVSDPRRTFKPKRLPRIQGQTLLGRIGDNRFPNPPTFRAQIFRRPLASHQRPLFGLRQPLLFGFPASPPAFPRRGRP